MNGRIIPVNVVHEPQQLVLPLERPEGTDRQGYWRAITKHKWAILGLALAVALLTSLVVSAALAAVHTYIGTAFPGVGTLWVWAL